MHKTLKGLTHALLSARQTRLQFPYILNKHLSHFSLPALYMRAQLIFLIIVGICTLSEAKIQYMHTMVICKDMDQH
jgi:hypothetical protein